VGPNLDNSHSNPTVFGLKTGINTITSSHENTVKGISVENSSNTHVFQNTINQFGSAVYATGAGCANSYFECNDIDNTWQGFNFNNATIKPNHLPGSAATDNEWWDIQNSQLNRLTGEVNSLVYWYYQQGLTSDAIPNGCMNIDVIQSNIANSNCGLSGGKLFDESADLSFYTDEFFYSIISNEYSYSINEASNKFWDEQYVYSVLKDFELTNPILTEWHDSMEQTNTGYIFKAAEALNQGDLESAKYFTDLIQDENEFFTFRKSVNEILIEYYSDSIPVLDSAQIKSTGGDCLFRSRYKRRSCLYCKGVTWNRPG
jgi:hypothetical protein